MLWGPSKARCSNHIHCTFRRMKGRLFPKTIFIALEQHLSIVLIKPLTSHGPLLKVVSTQRGRRRSHLASEARRWARTSCCC